MILTVLAGLVPPAGGAPPALTEATLRALTSWVRAVATHTPGVADQPVAAVATLSYEQRVELDAGMTLFLRALLHRPRAVSGNLLVERINGLGQEAARAGPDEFLKRAALLHADAGMYTDRVVTRTLEGSPRTRRETEDARRSPLLAASWFPLARDGEAGGEMPGSWHWPFARSLLDMLAAPLDRDWPLAARAREANDPFVARWYHAVAAYMFAIGDYGDLQRHLGHAADILPEDPSLLFDRGCYAELQGLPLLQRVRRPARSPSGGPHSWQSPGTQSGSIVPPASATNSNAERLYRRALGADPRLVEARVRLARLLGLRGRHQEAERELTTAFGEDMVPEVAYYAHLFAGRTAAALGRLDAAAAHYDAAHRLFPEAQSALLGSSHTALLQSDLAGAADPMRRLGASTARADADPWWRYHLGAGRDAPALLKDLWALMPPAQR